MASSSGRELFLFRQDGIGLGCDIIFINKKREVFLWQKAKTKL
jgi:hypothetical protein